MTRISLFIAATCVTALLAGCSSSSVRHTFGLDRTAPDEFQVVSRAPLVLPPEFTLRPPEPGARRPQETAPTQQARQTVFRAADKKPSIAVATTDRSPGETALLQEAGAGKAPSDIRRLVDQESTALVEADHSFIDKLLFWHKAQPPGVVIDAQKEERRLRENLALGKPVTAGQTPVIERKKRALLEGIF